MNRLIFPLAAMLACGVVPALAQDASPTPPPKENSDTSVSVGGKAFAMPDHCALAAYVEGRSEDLDVQRVTLRPWYHTLVGWEPGTPYATDAIDPASSIHDAHVGDLFCIGAVK